MQSGYRRARLRADPASPTQRLGAALMPKLIILALLAIAVFFYVRAVLPPGDGVARRQAELPPQTTQEGRETQSPRPSGNPSSSGSAPADVPAQEVTASFRPSGAPRAAISRGIDAKPVGALADVPAVAAPEKPPNEPTDGAAASSGVTGKPGSNGPLAVPGSQLEVIKRVFAPELLNPPDAGSGAG